MGGCYVYGCKSNSNRDTGVTFHRFPADPEKKKQWIKIMDFKEGYYPARQSRICSLHFEQHFFVRRKLKVGLSSDAIPTIFPKYPKNLQSETNDVKTLPKKCNITKQNTSHLNSKKSKIKLELSPTATIMIMNKNKKIKELQRNLKQTRRRINSLMSILKCLMAKNEVRSLFVP